MVVGVADLLRPDLRAHRRRSGRRHPGARPRDVHHRLPGQPDGPSQRDRRHPRPRRSRCSRCCSAASAAATTPPASWREPDMATLTATPAKRDQRPQHATSSRAGPPAPTGWVPCWLRLARDRDAADLLDRHHQLQDPDRLLRHQPLRAAHRADARRLPARHRVGLPRYFLNSVIVTVGAIVPAVLVSFLAAFAIVRGRRVGPPVDELAVPDGSGDPAAGDDHPRLPDHHPAAPLRHPAGDHPAVDRVRDPALGAGADQLHPGRPQGALRVDAHSTAPASGRRCGTWPSR